MRAIVVSNPTSYRGPYPVDRLRPRLEAAGWSIDVVERRPAVDVHGLLEPHLAAGSCDIVLSAGGDGTATDVAAEVAGRDVLLGILAGGSTNVVARELGMPRDPEGAAATLLASRPLTMDLGHLGRPDHPTAPFLLAAGLGLDAQVLAATSDRWKHRVGPLAIAAATLKVAPRAQPFEVAIDVDGRPLHEGRVWQVVLPNARRWGGVLSIAPGAAADDGLLDVVALRDRGRAHLLFDLAELLVLRHPHPSDVATGRGRRIEIRTPAPVALELDGTPIDPAAVGPFTIDVRPDALRVLAPRVG